MSTDSDDEDELLQMALKEQAHREVNYQRPSSSSQRKPVSNFVQPPKTAGSARPPPPTHRHQKSRGSALDDDDDSEVEMLSISSGDEEVSKDRQPAKGRAGAGGAGRGGKEDDGWDGGEPDCWKRVDEGELARRVRDMRESRIAPVAEKFDPKPTAAVTRKGLNTLLSLPRGMECIDPLGLGIIDNRTLRLVTENSASSPSKANRDVDSNLRDAALASIFVCLGQLSVLYVDKEESGYSGGNFNEGCHTSLQTSPIYYCSMLMCASMGNFIDIESKLRRIEEDPEGSGTSHLHNCMQGVNSLAVRAFEPLFERQAQAEKIRSVQGMLQRFRTLFNLPSTIRNSLSKGEYDLAVREYKKAKSVALPSHVNILKRVLEEVEKVMHEFKGTLYKSMEDPQIELTNLENTVRLLVELEPESDPVWHYLSVQNNRIRGLLEKCSLDHESRMETLYNEMKQRALLDAKWKQIQNETSDVDPVDLQSLVLIGEEVDSLRGKYIRRLTAVIIHHIPAFWKVAISVFSGKFAKSSQVSAESNLSASNKAEEKVVDVRCSTHSLDEVAGMIRSTISAYEAKVHGTFADLEESYILRSYMSDAIKEISKACKAFEVKESAPPTAALALKSLQAEITKIYILRLCTWMRATTAEMPRDETWTTVSVLERDKSPYRISFLPLAFRSVVASAMDQINLLVQSLKGEVGKSEDLYAQVQEIQLSIRLAFFNCFLDFAGHLEHIGTELVENKSNLQNGYSHEVEEKLSFNSTGAVSSHQKLLIVLSNIGYCKDELSHELFTKYKCVWLQSRYTRLKYFIIAFGGEA
ncbi:unnamed protein product [Linum tenue]|uniref:Exocyst complex component SEC5 n=1 Tax=Linum tenue TaxID=586396 RepID=A0AAV0GXW2_9ROSI|nr:unnamed protein product [Linum tenue]